MWNGAEEDLKPSPVMIIARPASRRTSRERCCPETVAAIRSSPSCPVAPYTSAEPKRSTADPKLPTTRYFSPASSEPTRSTSIAHRSEEHTSELQSRSDLVCRLLLEKKKKNI